MNQTNWEHFIPYPYIDKDINVINPKLLTFLQSCTAIIIFFTLFIKDVYNVFYKVVKKFDIDPGTYRNNNKLLLFYSYLKNCVFSIITFSLAYTYWRLYTLTDELSFLISAVYVAGPDFFIQYSQFFKTPAAATSTLIFHLLNVGINLIRCVQYVVFDGKYSYIGNSEYPALMIVPLFLHAYLFMYNISYYTPEKKIAEYFKILKKDLNIYPPVNFLEDITFTWMNPIINKVYEDGGIDNPYTIDLPPSDLNVDKAYGIFAIEWEKGQEGKTESQLSSQYLLLTLFKIHYKLIIIAITYNTIADYTRVLQPMVIRKILMFLELSENNLTDKPRIHLLSLGLYVCFLNILNSVLNNQFFIKIFEVGLKVKSTVVLSVYKKNLRLSFKSRSEKKTGDILNLISVDALKIQRCFEQSQPLIGLPVIIISTLLSLYQILGLAALPGLLIMIILIPINSKFSARLSGLFKRNMIFKDMRTKLITELLKNIKIVKIYNWQKPLIDRLTAVRENDELGNYAHLNYFNSLITFSWSMVPLLVSCSSFLSYSLITHKPLTANIIFTSVSLFNLLQECGQQLPSLITLVIESKVSLKRVQDFLFLEEADEGFIHYEIRDTLKPLIEVQNCDFLWESESQNPSIPEEDVENGLATNSVVKVALRGINFKAYSGKLINIIGRSGFSGKSTLLKSLLGILPVKANDATKEAKVIYRTAGNEYESIAYVSQHPWLVNASIKDNIIFGKKYDHALYEKVIAIGQLLPDLKIFADGDQTIVGGQGVSCSFGQLVRINICRALYSQAEIYVFDDILSALDASVGQAIIDLVLNDFLKDKCVIFATNSMKVLKYSDVIYYLEDCSISRVTSYNEIMADDTTDVKLLDIQKLILEHDKASTEKTNNQSSDAESEEIKDYTKEHIAANNPDESMLDTDDDGLEADVVRMNSIRRRLSNASLHPKRPLIQTLDENLKTKQKIEKIGKGKIKYEVYLTYLKNCEWKNVFLFVFFSVLLQMSDVLQKLWLKYWSDVGEDSVTRLNHYVLIYFILGLCGAFLESIRAVSLNVWCFLTSAGNLHRKMLKSVIDSPMSFFETTKASIILNRFTADVSTLDEGLEWCISSTLRNTMLYVCCVIIISISIPIWLLVNTCLVVLYTYYQMRYVVLSRDLRRFWAISFSPVIASLEELINGMDVIKKYQQVDRFNYFNSENMQFNVDILWSFRSTNRWVSVRLQSGSALVVLFITIFAIIKKDAKASLIAFLMNYAVQISNALMWIIRASVAIETNSKSHLNLPIDKTLPENWPQRGEIEFDNYSTTYRENLDPSLKYLNLKINPGEKVAICGRSGSGKSTLTLALFRILEPLTGTIKIDGVDVSKVGLSALRSGISIIPQTGDGQVFEGSLRYNLDPFDRYSEDKLINALKLSHLQPHMEKLCREERFYDNQNPEDESMSLTSPVTTADLLNVKIADNGANLSVGTKQLLCLARALLSENNILILDEASAALDEVTDSLIQETIRTEFKDKTVITIAHRLNTILSDSDKVIVLDRGKLQEYDSPKALIDKKEGLFYELCKKGGYI
ncbi:hypothetical protein ACO0OL_002755 [Hanseniaspora opuntiae]